MAGPDKKEQLASNESSPEADASSGEPAFSFHYDALDTLAGRSTSSGKEHRFYRNDELANEIQGGVSRTFLRAEGIVLAEQQTGERTPRLLAGDDKNSVLVEMSRDAIKAIAYSAYGHRMNDPLVSSPLGYNGERRETQTGWYLLGNGYRVFNPLLMRFHSPDSLSPFGKGGLNAYMYCVGDPINNVDPTGHTVFGWFARAGRGLFGSGRITTATPGIPFRLTKPHTVLGRNPHYKNRPTSLYPIEQKHVDRLEISVAYWELKAELTQNAQHAMNYTKTAELTKSDWAFADVNKGKLGITKYGAEMIKKEEKKYEKLMKTQEAKKKANQLNAMAIREMDERARRALNPDRGGGKFDEYREKDNRRRGRIPLI